MKKFCFFALLFTIVSQVHADYWFIQEVKPHEESVLIVMNNGTEWLVDDYQPVVNALRSFGVGQEVICSNESKGSIVFGNRENRKLLACSLYDYPREALPFITSIDTNGYFVELSDGSEWLNSWLSSWMTSDWKLDACVVVIRNQDDMGALWKSNSVFQLLNLDDLIKCKDGVADDAINVVWKN